MQKNKREIGQVLYKPSSLEPLVVNRCMVIGVQLTQHALSQNYNSGKKLDEYMRGDTYQIEYSVIEEGREGIQHKIYTEEALYITQTDAMEYVIKKAKEVLDI